MLYERDTCIFTQSVQGFDVYLLGRTELQIIPLHFINKLQRNKLSVLRGEAYSYCFLHI